MAKEHFTISNPEVRFEVAMPAERRSSQSLSQDPKNGNTVPSKVGTSFHG